MPRPQFMMINGKAVCIVGAGGRASKNKKSRAKIAKLQSQRNDEARINENKTAKESVDDEKA